jgi:hypothetical protein
LKCDPGRQMFPHCCVVAAGNPDENPVDLRLISVGVVS